MKEDKNNLKTGLSEDIVPEYVFHRMYHNIITNNINPLTLNL